MWVETCTRRGDIKNSRLPIQYVYINRPSVISHCVSFGPQVWEYLILRLPLIAIKGRGSHHPSPLYAPYTRLTRNALNISRYIAVSNDLYLVCSYPYADFSGNYFREFFNCRCIISTIKCPILRRCVRFNSISQGRWAPHTQGYHTQSHLSEHYV